MHAALKYLSNLCDTLEDDYDVDYTEGSLVINHTNGIFLLNYHGTMDQIWLSSPISGAHHFVYISPQWLCTRSNRDLEEVLRNDLDA